MKRVAALRLSLLVSMGLLPLACSAERLESNEGTAGSSTTMSTSACTSPKLDESSGLIACAEGYSHRPSAVACTPVAPLDAAAGGAGPAAQPAEPQAGFGGMASEPDCNQEPSRCDALPHGFCAVDDLGPDTTYYCASGCVTDADCGLNRICVCGHPESPTGGRCALSNCVTDADCGTGLLCASYEEGCGPGGFACLRDDDDECRSDADCEYDQCGIANDIFQPTEARRECGLSVCGRPFIIDLQARVAPLREGNEWGLAGLVPRLEHLSEADRAEQAAHWAHLGQMEHASIAAFARFSLQLLTLGAPPELVEACTQALADETRHARLCFQLASQYAGHGIAPGTLDIERSLDAASLVDIVDLVIAEGCVGETNAALEALAAAEAATDPVVANVYAQIAEDEQRHAALAFRFLRWALAQADAEVRPHLQEALLALPPTPTGRDVVAPCLRALLGQQPAAATAMC